MTDDLLNDPPGATPLDPDEMEGLKFQHVTTRGQLDHLEQANIEEGLLWLSKRKNTDILTDAYVRRLHEKLFGEVWQWAGKYRLTEKNIGIDPVHIGVELRNLLDDVRYWTENGTYDPLEAAARFHHRLVQIHVFPNGNGRHARIMADELLQKIYKEEPIDWLKGEDLQNAGARRHSYLEALRAADTGNYDPLMEFVGRD